MYITYKCVIYMLYLSNMLHGIDELEWGQLLRLRDVRDVEVPLDLKGGGVIWGRKGYAYMNRCKV